VGKMGWIIVLVLLFLLFRDKIGGAVDSVTGGNRQSGYNPLYGPPPGANYSSSPPVANHSSVTDIINSLIGAGRDIYKGINGTPTSTSPQNVYGSGSMDYAD
jgi:hypothetical protein